MTTDAYKTDHGTLHRGSNDDIDQETTTISDVKMQFQPSSGDLDIFFKVADDGDDEPAWRHLVIPLSASGRLNQFVASLPLWDSVSQALHDLSE